MTRSRRTMTVLEHLEELRARILLTLIPWLVLTALAFPFADDILAWLARPVGRLYVTAPSEALLTQLRLAVYAGAVLASPVALYQAAAFVLPGLTPSERRLLLLTLPPMLLLFLLGVAFGYLVALPLMLRFLMGFAREPLVQLISAQGYLSFVLGTVVPFGVAFELPLLVLALVRLGLVDAAALARWRKVAVLAILVVAAVFSPPDVVSQLVLAAPMLLLYEASVWVARAAGRRRGGEAARRSDGG